MKILFIEARKKFGKAEIEDTQLKKLPKNLHVLYTIQYKNLAEKIKNQLANKDYKILAFQQILGCSKIKPKASLFLIGSGRFHALQLAKTGKEVYIYDGKINKITKEDIIREKKREKGKVLKFLSSDKIGLLFSIKPGQNLLSNSLKFKRKLQDKFPKKKFYIFVSDNIDSRKLENFPCFFINFACPGISLDSKNIINYESSF